MTHDDKKPSDKVATYIDQNLKRVFADLAAEEVPDRFRDLLDRLENEVPINHDDVEEKP